MTTIDLGSLIREKLTQDEIDRLQHFDPDALQALVRAIADTPMPDAWRDNLQNLVKSALGDQRVQGILGGLGEWLKPKEAPQDIPTGIEKPWTDAELTAAEAFVRAMGDAGYEQFSKGAGCGRFMHCIRAALMAAGKHE